MLMKKKALIIWAILHIRYETLDNLFITICRFLIKGRTTSRIVKRTKWTITCEKCLVHITCRECIVKCLEHNEPFLVPTATHHCSSLKSLLLDVDWSMIDFEWQQSHMEKGIKKQKIIRLGWSIGMYKRKIMRGNDGEVDWKRFYMLE